MPALQPRARAIRSTYVSRDRNFGKALDCTPCGFGGMLFYTSFVRQNENESAFRSAADKASGKRGRQISSGRFGAGSDSGSGGS